MFTKFLRRGLLAAALAFAFVVPSYAPDAFAQFSAAPYDQRSWAVDFGTGADGNVSLSSGTTTITRDMHYANLTLSGTAVLKTNSFRVYVSGTLDIQNAGAGAIQANGPASNNATTAAGVYAASPTNGTLAWANFPLFTSGAGNTTTGTNPTVSVTLTPFGTSGPGGKGGNGGNGVSAGGTGANGQSINGAGSQPIGVLPSFFFAPTFNAPFSSAVFPSLYGGPGAQGGGDGTFAGGGGGGGGVGGGPLFIAARYIIRGASTAANCLQANGADGGIGANGLGGNAGGGGGGGGGSGGMGYIVTEALLGSTATNAFQALGGTGGLGGNGSGTGKGGNGGAGGGAGSFFLNVLSTPSYTYTQAYNAGTAGSTTSTSTGAAGGAGYNLQVNL